MRGSAWWIGRCAAEVRYWIVEKRLENGGKIDFEMRCDQF